MVVPPVQRPVTAWGSIPSRGDFYPCHHIQIKYGTQLVSYPIGTMDYFPEKADAT